MMVEGELPHHPQFIHPDRVSEKSNLQSGGHGVIFFLNIKWIWPNIHLSLRICSPGLAEAGKVDLLKKLFGYGTEGNGLPFEIVTRRLILGETKQKIIVRIKGRELFAEDFFRASLTDDDYSFGRFYILNEGLPNTHFAPSLEEALLWFRGKGAPKDGYGTVTWGQSVRYQCKLCLNFKDFHLRIIEVERLVVGNDLPHYREIVGWRVSKVANDFLGKGVPTKILELYKTVPVVRWDSGKKKYLCQSCASRLERMGRSRELANAVIFAPD